MQPNKDQNNNSNNQALPQHMPISQIKEQLEGQKNGTPTIQTPPSNPSNPRPSNSINQELITTIKPTNVAQPTNTNNANHNQSSSPTPPNNLAVQKNEANSKTPTIQDQQSNVKATQQLATQNSLIPALIWLQFISLFVIAAGFIPPMLWRNTFLMVFGMLLIGAAIMLAIWAVTSFKQIIKINPKPNPNGFLVTGGPYKYLRHPMYLALMMASIGIALAYPTIPRIIALAVLFFVLNTKMNIEEKLLTERYHHYDRYQRVSGKIIPKFKKPDIDIDIPKFQ